LSFKSVTSIHELDMTPTSALLLPAEASMSVLPPTFDARLRVLARQALKSSGYTPVSTLDCHVSDGVVVLRGVVNSYYLKQVAQESVRRLGLADRIDNRVTVRYS
jgi:BON domain